MQQTVDVITPVHASHARFLAEAWRSLCAQTHGRWAWLLQVDGPADTEVERVLAECGALGDPRLRLAVNGVPAGPAATRNVALGRSSSALVQVLDADDQLEPDAIDTLAGALRANPDAGYAVGHARDLLPDGTVHAVALPVTPGRLGRGVLARAWTTTPDHYRVPVHPAGVLWRRDLLVAAGGWSGMYGMEDTGLLMAASALADGVFVDHPTLRYRIHDAQHSRRPPKFLGGGGLRIARPSPCRVVAGVA